MMKKIKKEIPLSTIEYPIPYFQMENPNKD